jgi:hypothetical protein
MCVVVTNGDPNFLKAWKDFLNAKNRHIAQTQSTNTLHKNTDCMTNPPKNTTTIQNTNGHNKQREKESNRTHNLAKQ